jgi:hypothetical protein
LRAVVAPSLRAVVAASLRAVVAGRRPRWVRSAATYEVQRHGFRLGRQRAQEASRSAEDDLWRSIGTTRYGLTLLFLAL